MLPLYTEHILVRYDLSIHIFDDSYLQANADLNFLISLPFLSIHQSLHKDYSFQMHFIESLFLKKCDIRYSKLDSNDKGHKNSNN